MAAGFYNWFGEIDHKGYNLQGIMKPLESSILKRFLPWTTNSEDLRLMIRRESRSIAQATEFYKDLAQSMENSFSNREKMKEQQLRYQQYLANEALQDFREKYLSPVDFDE